MPPIYKPPYTVKFWYPASATYEAATYSMEVKAYEVGNTDERARNQTFSRTRGGVTKVYDRGQNFDTHRKLHFKNIQDLDRAKWLVFLAAVQWGASKLAFLDHTGTQYVVRIENPKLAFTDNDYICRDTLEGRVTLWNFDIDLLDLTDSGDLTLDEVPPLSALGLHLLDYNHPHNPKTTISLSVADGAKVVEQLKVDDWGLVHWFVEVIDSTLAKRASMIISCVHNGTPSADATTINNMQATQLDPSGILAGITWTTVLSGAGTVQYMQLKAASATLNSLTISVRRIKL